jgi:hypothetical protein
VASSGLTILNPLPSEELFKETKTSVMDYKQTEGERQTDVSEQASEGFLVSEETENVDASGVDDESDGNVDDYLGKTNNENRDKEEQ